MRPQHDGHDGRPSPQSQTVDSPSVPPARSGEAADSPFVPRARSGETTDFFGRIRQDRPAGKPGRHRLDAAATQRAARATPVTPEPLPLPSAGSPPASVEVPPAGEIAPAWHDLVEAPVDLPAMADLTPASGAWRTPRTIDVDDVWDSTEEYAEEPREAAAAPAILEAPAKLDKTALAEQVASLEDRYLTPAGPLTPGLAPVRRLRGPVKAARYAALGFLALVGIGAVVSQSEGPKPTDDLWNSAQSIMDDRTAAAAADRSQQRGASPSATPQASASATPSSSASPKPTPTKKAKPAVAPLPIVAGFDKAQMTNARTIVQTGQKLGVPSRGLLIALMTAMQESDLYNQASQAVPESFNYPHQGDSVDYDSCGLFQQRASMGWGTVKQIMDPVYSSTKFYQGLLQVAGWQSMELTLAAQAVQGSAFPYAYAQHEAGARAILNALT